MFWKYVSSISITNRLLLIFLCATLLILVVITGLVYPPMKEMLTQARVNHQYQNYLLAQICINKFFIGLWCSALVVIGASYLLAQKSMLPIKKFTQELNSINASSLNTRLQEAGHPKELQQLATTCNAMLLRIEKNVQQIKKFSASMAHELRNPVHYLQTATEITLSKPQSVETYQHLLHQHLEEYQSLASLIDNLLFLTRSENRHIELKLKILSANSLVSSVIDYYHFIAQTQGVEIQVSGDATIEVDEHLFKRVLANLIDNSLAHTPKEGKISIAIEKRLNGSVQISVKDTGAGIEKEHIPFICQEFYRIETAINKERSSLGLGLAIAKSIMDNHQGQLHIESQPNTGTTVTLLLKKVTQN
jgi:two-component system, OmpR family, heavy metal sensor histidine kinase CusS